MIKATFIKDMNWLGDARLYKLSEPIDYVKDYSNNEPIKVDHIIVSGVFAYSGPETYIFPADSEGETISMLEMDGSFRGEINHEQAINNAGYVLADSVIDIEFEEVNPLQLD